MTLQDRSILFVIPDCKMLIVANGLPHGCVSFGISIFAFSLFWRHTRGPAPRRPTRASLWSDGTAT